MTILETRFVNDFNREVWADGDLVGWVTYMPPINARIVPGWTFTVADKRLTNRFPDGNKPMPTWQQALPS